MLTKRHKEMYQERTSEREKKSIALEKHRMNGTPANTFVTGSIVVMV